MVGKNGKLNETLEVRALWSKKACVTLELTNRGILRKQSPQGAPRDVNYDHCESCDDSLLYLRDWSLITGRGGATKREGGHVKFYPYEKGGHNKFWGSFYTVA